MCLALVAIKSWVFFVLHTRPLNCCQKKKTEPTSTPTPIKIFYSPSIVHHNESATFRNLTRRTRG